MSLLNNKRLAELEQKRKYHKDKVIELNNWLLKNFDHPERPKIFRDKAWHECEINIVTKKIQNIIANVPENGYGDTFEQTIPRTVINKSQQ